MRQIVFIVDGVSGKVPVTPYSHSLSSPWYFTFFYFNEETKDLKNSEFLWYHLQIKNFPWQKKTFNAQKMEFSIKDFFSKCDQMRSFHFLCSVSSHALCWNFWFWWKVKQKKLPIVVYETRKCQTLNYTYR